MITIIFGNPGAGKTKLMTKFAVERMLPPLSHDLLRQSIAEIKRHNGGGYEFSFPQKHVVFTDYGARAVGLGYAPRTSYYVDGFRLGLPNNRHETMLLPFYSQIFLTEGQKYFNSRMSNYFSDFVSRFYETHRHYGLDIFIDCQRPDLIDLNVRAIAECFIEVVSTSNKHDRLGNIVSSTWECNVLKSCYAVDRYLKSGDKSECVRQKFKFAGDIHACYDSYYFKSLHLNNMEYNDFMLYKSPSIGCDVESVRRFNDFYGAETPETFYTKRGSKVG